MRVLAGLASVVLVFALSACQRPVDRDYQQYLENNVGESQLPTTNKASQYFLTPETKAFHYEFRSFMSGPANLWTVEFGKMLEDTLKSKDVQTAFGSLTAVESASAPGNTLVFELRDYKFEDFTAQISLNIRLTESGTVTFEKEYVQIGKGQGGKMFWGGEFAQKNAVQQSTKLAMDEILKQLITDLNGLQ